MGYTIKFYSLVFIGIIILHMLMNNFVLGQNKNEELRILNLGYSKMIFQDVDPRDGNAALIAYAQQIEKRFYKKESTRINLSAKIYTDLPEIKRALRKNEIDILSVPSDQYFELTKEFELEPCLTTVAYNNKFTQYILITSKKFNINNLSGLKGKSLLIPKSSKGWLVEKWLNLLLLKSNYNLMNDFFRQVKYQDKEASIIYDIHFGNAECGLVRKSVLTTLAEFNPQINNSIKIIETSEPVIAHLLAYRKSADASLINSVIKESNELHLSREGKLILEIFKSTKIEKITDDDLRSVKMILDGYNALIRKKGTKK